MYGILHETKRNMVTRVIRGQPFDFPEGRVERDGVKIYSELFFSLTETKFKLLIFVTDRILYFFFSKVQIKAFTYMNTGVHPI